MSEPAAHTQARVREYASLVERLGAGSPAVAEVVAYLHHCADLAAEPVGVDPNNPADMARQLAAARAVAQSERARREALEAEALGSRLWFELARALVYEAQPLLPRDKAALIEPLRAARVAASDRTRLAEVRPLLRLAHEHLNLLSVNEGDAEAGRIADAIRKHIEAST